MDINNWLKYGVDNYFITTINDGGNCSFGFEINNNNKIINYLDFKNISQWYGHGKNVGWITQEGCIKHELKNPAASVKYFHHANSHKLNILDKTLDQFNGLSSLINKEDGYYPSYPESIKKLIENAQFSPANLFIDIGYGKGLPFYIASQYKYYNKYLGIEIDNNYKNECIKNNTHIKNQLELITCDANDFILPNIKSHIFMFNPFNNTILNNFLTNNEKIIKQNKSLILYNNDYIAKHLILSFGFKQIVKLKNNISIYQ